MFQSATSPIALSSLAPPATLEYATVLTYAQKANASDSVVRTFDTLLAQGKTDYQSYLFFTSPVHGTCIALDGDVQSCASDEALYHEALVHPAILLHPEPKIVLIMGGGEGATSREVLRHVGVEKVVMVDIDREFVSLCVEHIPEWNAGAFDNPRHEIRYEDIRKFIAETDLRFDVVIGDLVDFDDADEGSIAAGFYSDAFYTRLKSCLNDDAILATQAGPMSPANLPHHNGIRDGLRTAFGGVQSYATIVPSFYGLWSYVIAGPQLSELAPEAVREQIITVSQQRNFSPPATGIRPLAATFELPEIMTQGLK
ncbi:MAG: spermidine synthase [Pseudomonadota bacterium]